MTDQVRKAAAGKKVAVRAVIEPTVAPPEPLHPVHAGFEVVETTFHPVEPIFETAGIAVESTYAGFGGRLIGWVQA